MEKGQEQVGASFDVAALHLGGARAKAWGECGIEEKVERLRRALIELRWGVQDARRRAHHFDDHAHDASGHVVVPLRSTWGEAEPMSIDVLA